MFDIVAALVQAWLENRRLANKLADMTARDFADIGVAPSDAPRILRENFKRVFVRKLETRIEARNAGIQVLRRT